MANSLSTVDRLVCGLDRALRTVVPQHRRSERPSPAERRAFAELDDRDRRHACGLMRVNHAGEVCAQALYQGQALTAKLPEVRAEMEAAAEEENDHLAWCETRIRELGERPSVLNPLWYLLSFSIGAGAGLISDRLSLGFVAATEDQVCEHLRGHLDSLPANDEKSRAVVSQMLEDEARHAHNALQAGGLRFPGLVKRAMTLVSKAMTQSSYRI